MALDLAQPGAEKAHTVLVDELKTWRRVFVLCRPRWATCALDTPLSWQRVPLLASGSVPAEVPDNPGVYCLTIVNRNPLLPEDSYVVYAGIVGHKTGSTRTLRSRYLDYARLERVAVKRPKVNYLLNKWEGSIDFQFAAVTAPHRLPALETSLLDSLIPLANQRDFSAELGKAVAALD